MQYKLDFKSTRELYGQSKFGSFWFMYNLKCGKAAIQQTFEDETSFVFCRICKKWLTDLVHLTSEGYEQHAAHHVALLSSAAASL